MSKHTPGPWSIIPQNNGDQLIAHLKDATGKNMRLIGFVMSREASIFEDINNANLIAAAPEMLETLKLMTCYLMEMPKEDQDKLIKIIKKAQSLD